MPDKETLKRLARELRSNATKEENELWYKYLSHHEVRFTRQKPMEPYIVDFYCPKARLVIELDGSQHYEDGNIEKDAERTRYLEGHYGVKVVRIPNNEINENLSGVCDYLERVIKERVAIYGGGWKTAASGS